MTNTERALAPFRRFRVMAVRGALLLTAVCTAVTYAFDTIAAQGLLMGGIAGILGFWIMAVRLEKLASLTDGKVEFSVLTWTAFRFALYGAVLYKAFSLDTESMRGLMGAVAGILIIRLVLMFLGFTGTDLAKTDDSARANDDTTNETT